MACDEKLRFQLGNNLRHYLDKVVSWEVVATKYDESYGMARNAKLKGKKIEIPPEF